MNLSKIYFIEIQNVINKYHQKLLITNVLYFFNALTLFYYRSFLTCLIFFSIFVGQ